jgi:hypothetical protein
VSPDERPRRAGHSMNRPIGCQINPLSGNSLSDRNVGVQDQPMAGLKPSRVDVPDRGAKARTESASVGRTDARQAPVDSSALNHQIPVICRTATTMSTTRASYVTGLSRMRLTARISACVLLLVLAGCGWSQPSPPKQSRFLVDDGRLYALLDGDTYTTDDAGRTWIDATAPKATYDLTSNGQETFAITMTGEIWSKRGRDGMWTVLKRSGSTGFGQRQHLYSLVAAKDRTLCVLAEDGIRLLDRTGHELERLPGRQGSSSPLDRELYWRVRFAGPDQREAIVEASPFAVYVLGVSQRTLTRWTDGMSERRPPGLWGPCRVVRHGDGFLADNHDGVYVADGLLKPWRALWKPLVDDDGLGTADCRALCTFDSSNDQWLMADTSGIHLMHRAQKLRTVFVDKMDEHDLILDITPFEGRYFVSFARLKEGVLGIVLSGDLSHWETIRGLSR